MITEHLIRQNQARHQELLHEAAQSRARQEVNAPSAIEKALASTGVLLVAAGQGLQRRYRRMEEGVALADYNQNRRVGRTSEQASQAVPHL